MKVLIADDDAVARRVLQSTIGSLSHEVTVVEDGREAWACLREARYDVLITDWVMPHIDGLELCRRVRGRPNDAYTYVILVSARNATEDIVRGIMAGADDFLTKPCAGAELRARLHAAERVVKLERSLAGRLSELECALDEVATLKKLLPICMYCKSIRNDQQAWDNIEEYLRQHAHADLTHSICPSCYESRVQPMLDELHEERGDEKMRKGRKAG